MLIKTIYSDKGNTVDTWSTFNGADVYERTPGNSLFFVMRKTSDSVKALSTTREFETWWLGKNEFAHPIDHVHADILYSCPHISMWCAEITYKDSTDVLKYFRVPDSTQLSKVAEYYKLPYPVSAETSGVLDVTPELIGEFFNDNDEVCVLGSVRFNSEGTPIQLCLETMNWEYGNGWYTNFIGNVYVAGVVQEVSRELYKRGVTKLVGSTKDEDVEYIKEFSYVRDPLVNKCRVSTDKVTGESSKEVFSSSTAWLALVNLVGNIGNMVGLDLAPMVGMWVGKGVDSRYTRVFYYAESSSMVKEVSDYYGLPHPVNEEMFTRLDVNPESFRVRHYDLYKRGPGNWVPLVLGSIKFVDGVARESALYERTRWNEPL